MSDNRIAVQFYNEIRSKGSTAIRELADLAEERGATITHNGQTRSRKEALYAAADRLESNNFVIALVGEFSRGKSSLLNALLERPELLPTSIEPSTAAITILHYGKTEVARVTYTDGTSVDNVPLGDLSRHVVGQDLDGKKAFRASSRRLSKVKTQQDVDALSFTEIGQEVAHQFQASAGKTVKYVDVFVDSSFLKDGITLVDTPGIGSVNPEHGQATREYIDKADAVIFLINTDPVISESECNFLMFLEDYIEQFVFAVTKIDRFSEEEREQSINYSRRTIEEYAGITDPPIYPVSAKLVQEGRLENSGDKIRASGFPTFQEGLERYLIRERGRRLLDSTSREARMHLSDITNSIESELSALSLSAEEVEQRVQGMHKGLRDAQYVRQAISEDIDKAIRSSERLITGDFDWLRVKATLKRNISEEINTYTWGELQRANELLPLFVKGNLKELLSPLLTGISHELVTAQKDAMNWVMETLSQLGLETGIQPAATHEQAEWEISFETSSNAFQKNLQKVGTMTVGSTIAFTVAGVCLFGGIGAIAMIGGLLLGGGTTPLMLKRTKGQLEKEVITALDAMMDRLLEDLQAVIASDLNQFRSEITQLLDSSISNVTETLQVMEREHTATDFDTARRQTELEAQLDRARKVEESLNHLRMFAGYVAGEHLRSFATGDG